jgi:hypothetical protein
LRFASTQRLKSQVSEEKEGTGMTRFRIMAVVLAMAIGVTLAVLDHVRAQQIHKNGFEGRQTSWLKDAADAPYREIDHSMTKQFAHTGERSEHIHLMAEQGTYIHYVYPTGQAPIADELSARLWVKANRPGIQVLARVVLPHEPDPKNLDARLTTIIRGDVYQQVGRWEPLELRHPVKLVQEQQQLMRLDLKRDVNFTDAYIDRLILNVYGGPGDTELWIDDLEIGPVANGGGRRVEGGGPSSLLNPSPSTFNPPPSSVRFQDGLQINGNRFFLRGIRHSGTPLDVLRRAGFNAVFLDYRTPADSVQEAIQNGFWIVPTVPVTSTDPRLASASAIDAAISQFPGNNSVLFWDLGSGLTSEQAHTLDQAVQSVRTADPERPLGADVWDGFWPYSLSLNLVGAHRWPLMTSLELNQYREWLTQRLFLCRPGTFLWTWVQTHLPDWYTRMIYQRPAEASFTEAIGPQPEQIRLLTYLALAAGCRGVAFWSDQFLADSHQGRDRLLELALLNQEMQMLEPLLTTAETPFWIDTSDGNVKAAVFRGTRGVLVLPIWSGTGSQFVPGQSAVAQLKITVPGVPAGTQAWRLSPARVDSLKTERVIGGTQVTLRTFGLTAAILFTADLSGTIAQFQEENQQMQRMAAQWAYELAQTEMGKITQIERQLIQAGHAPPDTNKLLAEAQKRLQECVVEYNSGDYGDAYDRADEALRPVRILMRAQWEAATTKLGLETAVTSPYAVSFFTLPMHWKFVDELRRTIPGTNVLPDGDFEVPGPSSLVPGQKSNDQGAGTRDQGPGTRDLSPGWALTATTLDRVTLTMSRVSVQPKSGKQCLMLKVSPTKGKDPPPAALERTFLAVSSPMVHLQPGTKVRITGWIRIPKAITGSVDGALMYDRAGGEPLAIRMMASPDWKRLTLFREVPADGLMNVTLALTGIGTVYFDDIRIEPLLPQSLANRP